MSICYACGCTKSLVTDSRRTGSQGLIRRRRECENCGRRYGTVEIPLDHHPRVKEMIEWLIDETKAIYGDTNGGNN